MKGGKTPIHLWGRWSPADFLDDEAVKLVASRGDTASLAVYFMVLQTSHRAGGDLPADREELAALLGMPRRVVERGLAIWLERGKLAEENGRLFHWRVQAEVHSELEFRESQAELGRKGGLVRASRQAQGKPKASLDHASSVPQARRSPAPAPAPAPAPTVPAVPAGEPAIAWSRIACDAWIERLGGTAPGGQIGRALKPLVDRHGWEIVRQAWVSYLRQVEPEYASPSRFASTFGRWGGTAAPAAKSTVADRTVANLEAWVAGKEGGS